MQLLTIPKETDPTWLQSWIALKYLLVRQQIQQDICVQICVVYNAVCMGTVKNITKNGIYLFVKKKSTSMLNYNIQKKEEKSFYLKTSWITNRVKYL